MSYTQHACVATCKLDAPSLQQLITDLYDGCVNHAEDLPDTLAECEDLEEFSKVVSYYVDLSGNTLTIAMDSVEDNNYDSEVFDFLTNHYINFMTSKFMKVTWTTYDSRDGMSGDTCYYDKEHNQINVEELLENV